MFTITSQRAESIRAGMVVPGCGVVEKVFIDQQANILFENGEWGEFDKGDIIGIEPFDAYFIELSPGVRITLAGGESFTLSHVVDDGDVKILAGFKGDQRHWLEVIA